MEYTLKNEFLKTGVFCDLFYSRKLVLWVRPWCLENQSALEKQKNEKLNVDTNCDHSKKYIPQENFRSFLWDGFG